MIRWAAIGLSALAAVPAAAADLPLPAGMQMLSERASPLASYQLPVAVFDGEGVPSERFEGQVVRRSWRVALDASPLQIAAPVRAALEEAGYEVLFQCAARECGGFDFRFGTEVIPAPDMTVDLNNYYFLSARNPGGSAVSLLVSHSVSTAYIQLIEVVPAGSGSGFAVAPPPAPAPVPRPEPAAGGLAGALLEQGRAVLPDLEYETGSARLGSGEFASLAALAAFLAAHPGAQVVLVGHTDSQGSLSANTSISQRRAEAVRDRLAEKHGVDPGRVSVAGAGYLAPVASNLTDEGREANRRVEAVLLSQ